MEITDAEVNNPNVQKYLASIGTREGTDTHGYNTQVGGSRFEDLSKHPNNPTVKTDAGISTAAGKYQITGTTFRGLQGQYGFKDFSAATQDKAAVALIKEKGAFEDVTSGNFQAADAKLPDIWESFKPKGSRAKVSTNWGTAFTNADGTPDSTGVPTRDYNSANLQRNGASPSEVLAAKQAEDNARSQINTWDALKIGANAAIDNDMAVVNWWKTRAPDVVPDPNFTKGTDFVQQFSKDIKPENFQYVYDNATSLQHAEQLRQIALQKQELDKQYEAAPFSAGVSRLVTGAFSPENIGIMGLTMVAPAAGVPLAASRWGRLGYGALEGAATNAALEGLTSKYRVGSTSSDLAYATALGLVLGGAGGAASKGFKERIRLGQETAFDNDLAHIQNWSLDQLHTISREDFAHERMFPDELMYSQMSQAEREFNQLKFMQEYDFLVAQKKLDTIHGTGDLRPPEKVGDVVETKAPFKKTWDTEWDTPAYHKTRGWGDEVLQLPPNQPLESLFEYTRLYSKDRAMVAWMDKMLEGIDTTKLNRFEVGSGKAPAWYANGYKIKGNAGHVHTPYDSLGTSEGGLMQFVLQGQAAIQKLGNRTKTRVTVGKGDVQSLQTGLSDHVLVHELAHVSSAYKLALVNKDKNLARRARYTKNIEGDARTVAAVEGMDKLFSYVKKHMGAAEAKKHYGMTNVDEFLAEGISNKVFQAALRAIPLSDKVGRTNVMTQFLDHIMGLLGINKAEQTAFHKFLELAEPITEKGGISLKAKVSNAPADGYRAMPHSSADADTALAAEVANIPETFSVGLGLENKLQKGTLPSAVRWLSQKLFGSTTGYKGNHVVEDNAWDSMLMARDGWNAQLRKGTIAPFMKWEQEQGFKFYQRGEAYDQFGEQVWKNVIGFEGDYDPQVIKAANTVRKNMADRVENINNPARDTGGSKRGLTEVEFMQADGTMGLTGKLEQNPYYMPRVHDSNKWADMISTHGEDKVQSFWAAAYRSGREGEISEKDAAQFAKWYSTKVNDAKSNLGSGQHLSDILRGQDKGALLDSIKQVLPDITPEELSRFTDQIMGVGKDDAGRIVGNLKHRNNINERYVGAVGSDIEGWTIADFVKTNAMEITQSYNNRVAGNVSLANHLDVYKASDIAKHIDKATEDNLASPFRKSDLMGARKDLQFAFDRILGIPQVEGFSAVDQSLSMFRDFNVIRLMSGAVYNQLVETAQMTGTVGWRSLISSIPLIGSISRDAKTGRAPSAFLDHAENVFGGAGAEYMNRLDFTSHRAWGDQYGKNSFQGKYLDPAATAIKKVATGTLDYTGMTGLMVQQKRLHVTALTNGFIDLANGIDNGGGAFLTKERLAWMGLSEKDFGDLKGVLKSLSSKGEGAIKADVTKIDWDAFQANHTELHHKLMRAVMRESRRVIQENDLGSMIPWMGTTLGKTMGQFMNFSLNAWNKQLMFGLNHADLASANTMFQGMMLGSIVYSARMQQQAMGMEAAEKQKFLEDRMSVAKVVANGWSRTGASSMLPNIASTVLPAGMGGDLFAGGRTTSDLSGIMSMPTVGLVNTALSLGKKTLVKSTSDTEQFNRSDVKALFKLMPFQNLVGVNSIINNFTSTLPVSSKQGEQ